MPPRTVKRGAAQRRSTGRATRGSQKAQNQPPPEEAPETAEEAPPVPAGETKPDVEADQVVQQSPPPVVDETPAVVPAVKSESKSDDNGFAKEEKIKESVEEYEKDERLELEDNDPEYETEEYTGIDYDEKEIDPEDDVQEIGDEEEEEDLEDNLDEEDEGDEDEQDDVREELEGEEYEEHAGEEQVNVERTADVDAEADEAEHHEVVKERRKRKEFEIFVGGLDKDATEGDLRKVFSVIGEVTEVRLMMNPQTKKNKGFAFLRYATVEQAKRAVAELKHPMVNGKQCGVTPSQDSDTLFLGNICKKWTKEALKEKLKHYKVENVEDLTLVEDGNNQGLNRGFAFLEFSSRSEAMEAFKRLQKRDIVFGVDRPAKVSFADSFIDPGDEIMAQVKTVFIDGLPATWDEERVRGLLKKYGEVVKIELARNMPSAKRKDFGFVTYGTHDAAVTCAKSINNSELGEGDTKAKVRARLSRPLQKGKGKHSRRGDLRSSRSSGRAVRGPWGHPPPRRVPSRGVRGSGSRAAPPSRKRPVGIRDRRPVMSVQARSRPLPPPSRSYDKRAPVSSYPKSGSKREYSRREEIAPPRSRAVVDYGPRVVVERRPSYRDEYAPRGHGFSDPPPRSTSRTSSRRDYGDDGYCQRYERHLPPPPLPPSYREGRGRDYDSVPGSKRPYSSMDDIPRYADSSVRQSRARLDYDYAASASQYGNAYSDRLERPNLGYSSSRTSQDSHGMYGSRQGMGYGGGGMYSSSYGGGGGGGGYVSRGSDVGGSSYSSLYPGRGGGGSGYMGGGGGSGSYY